VNAASLNFDLQPKDERPPQAGEDSCLLKAKPLLKPTHSLKAIVGKSYTIHTAIEQVQYTTCIRYLHYKRIELHYEPLIIHYMNTGLRI
jgi:hypothetical protein